MLSLPGELTKQESEMLASLTKESLPEHVAIIMDGNGRWARKRAQNRLFGHSSARAVVKRTVETARHLGLKCLTLYAFSTENWRRPKAEVIGLMKLLEIVIAEEVPELHENGIRVLHIGEKDRLPDGVKKSLTDAEELTKDNKGMTLALAINYGGRREIVLAAQKAARLVQEGEIQLKDVLDEEKFESYLQMSGLPTPDLMIRTAGEQRISNFLLWELAYAELHFTEVLWPDFGRKEFLEALVAFASRERRYGGVLS